MLGRIAITPKQTVHRAKTLRQRMTKAERLLWRKLRAHRFHGLKFRRQTGVGRFIPDFVCIEHMLIVELDGDSQLYRKAYDKKRQDWLESIGFKVIRFHNDHVIESIDFVLQKIASACDIFPSPSPSPAGRGKATSIFDETPYIS
jgi:very-short-patch-repair endonuclease